MFSLRSIFQSNKRKYATTRFPPNWPSYLHNKCSDAMCCFPNPPQSVAGFYTCQGNQHDGKLCPGTYEVSSAMARSTLRGQLVPSAPRTSPRAQPPSRPPRPEERALHKKASRIHGLSQRRISRTIRPIPQFAEVRTKPQPAIPTHYTCYAGPVQSYFAPAVAYNKTRAQRQPMTH